MKKLFCSLLIIITTYAFSDDAQIKKSLESIGVTNIIITDSPISALRTAISDQGIFYATQDGQYLFQGVLAKVTPSGIQDISNRPLLQKLESFSDQMIIYPAKLPAYTVTVFTDIDCQYCAMMHRDIKKYTDLGITIRYLAFPRNGLNTKEARQMETVWHEPDRNAALDAAMNNSKQFSETPVDMVKAHYNLGQQFGIVGTPAIVTPEGSVIFGYKTPEELLSLLQKK